MSSLPLYMLTQSPDTTMALSFGYYCPSHPPYWLEHQRIPRWKPLVKKDYFYRSLSERCPRSRISSHQRSQQGLGAITILEESDLVATIGTLGKGQVSSRRNPLSLKSNNDISSTRCLHQLHQMLFALQGTFQPNIGTSDSFDPTIGNLVELDHHSSTVGPNTGYGDAGVAVTTLDKIAVPGGLSRSHYHYSTQLLISLGKIF